LNLRRIVGDRNKRFFIHYRPYEVYDVLPCKSLKPLVFTAFFCAFFCLYALDSKAQSFQVSPSVHKSSTAFCKVCPDNCAIRSTTKPFLIDLSAIKTIESSGRVNAIGDGGKALGEFQLHKAVIDDYNRAFKTSYSHSEALNPKTAHKIAHWYFHNRIPSLLKHYKRPLTLENVLTSYNMGIGAVLKGKTAKNYIQKYRRLAQ
jgi:hypothetical protein